MPFILPKSFEFDRLSPNLSESDIKNLMKSLNQNLITAYTISKQITSRTENTDPLETLHLLKKENDELILVLTSM
jgi:hypothetical protein